MTPARSSPPSAGASGRGPLVLVAALVLAGLAAWGGAILLGDDEGAGGGVAGRVGADASAGDASLPGARGRQGAGGPEMPPGARDGGAVGAWTAGNLRLHVVDERSGEPLPDVRLSLYADGVARAVGAGSAADIGVDGGADAVAGAAASHLLGNPIGAPDAVSDGRGVVELDVPPGVPLRLIAYGAMDRVGQRLLAIEALGPTERRDVRVEMPVAEGVEFWGRVVDDARGDAVEGATVVLLGGVRGSSGTRTTSARREVAGTRTDARGLFALHPSPFAGAHVRVEADGYGPVLCPVDDAHAGPEHAQELRLARAGGLDAEVLDGRGLPLQGAVLTVAAPSGHLVRPEGAALLADDLRLSAPVGHDGRLALRGLPAGAPLAVTIEQGGRLLLREDAALTLAPGEIARRTWRVAGRARLLGEVVDQRGAPVGDVELWLLRQALPGRVPGQPCFLEAGDALSVVARCRSDAAGRFAFPEVPAGTWLVGPAPAELVAPVDPSDAVSAWARPVEIASDRPETRVTLEVSRGLLIEGVVLGPDGDALAGRTVRAWAVDGAPAVNARADEDGAFLLGPLLPGAWRVQAAGGEGAAPSEPVVAQAGDTRLVLRLRSPSRLEGRLAGAPGEDLPPARLTAWAEGPQAQGAEPAASAWSDPDDGFRVDGLAPGRYDLTAHLGDGRVGLLRAVDVGPGQAVSGLVLSVQAGARLRIRYDGAARYGRFTILCEGAAVASDSVHAGTSKLVTVPPGPVEVRFVVAGRAVGAQTLRAEPGEPAELSFTDG